MICTVIRRTEHLRHNDLLKRCSYLWDLLCPEGTLNHKRGRGRGGGRRVPCRLRREGKEQWETMGKPWSQTPNRKPWSQTPNRKPWLETLNRKPWSETLNRKLWSQTPNRKPWLDILNRNPGQRPLTGDPGHRPLTGNPGHRPLTGNPS